MRYTLNVRLLALASLVVAMTVVHAGCSAGDRQPTSGRFADPSLTQPRSPTEPIAGAPPEGHDPAASAGNGQPSPQAPAAREEGTVAEGGAATRPAAPIWPAYISLLGKLEADGPASITATAKTPRSLSLTTRNVSRFRIHREGSPLRYGANVILRIDGQALEWTGRYEALVLERSRNGVWEVAERVDREPRAPVAK